MRNSLLLAGALLALGTPVTAQWSDNFDAYTSGTVLDNVGGWSGWDNTPAAAGIVDSSQAYSAANSMFCGPGVDAVHPALGATSGKWTMRAKQYVPSGGVSTAAVYFILNNDYTAGGPYTWTTQLQCNGTTIDDDLRTSTAQPLVFDQWAEIRADIDLDADTVAYYYNGALISQGTYAVNGGPVEIQNIDLFSNGGTCYWDDVVLEKPWTDNFDSYTSGTVLDNVGGWSGWDNTPAAAGIVDSTQASSAPNSMFCGPGVDAVHPDLGVTSGKWTMRAKQYIPSGGVSTAAVFFILNNDYTAGGPYTWTTQLQCNGTTIDDDLRTSTAQPLVFDQWAEIRADIDLDADTVAYYYNGALISQGTYAVNGGPVEIQNIDLFSNGGTCYWDDIALEPATLPLVEVYGAGCPGTGGLVPSIGATGLPTPTSTNFSVDLSQANANSSCILLVSGAPASTPLGSCTVLLAAPVISAATVPTSATGTASLPIPVPGVVAPGTMIYMQWAVLDSNGSYFNTLTFSDGLSLRIGR